METDIALGGRQSSQTIWELRWQALEKTIETLAECYDVDFSRKQTAYGLLKRFHAFAKGHFYFFAQGFQANEFYSLQESPNYPPDYVLRVILDQIGYDLDLLHRVLAQRSQTGKKSLQMVLETADKLALNALQPAISNSLVPYDTTVITYFQKSASIRVIPYAHVALVAIPYTCLSDTTSHDYLAIPHEVGHYVYRHGDVGGTSIPAILADETKGSRQYVKDWLEEIFADVYGCLVAGPVMVLDFQDLQLDEDRDGFTKASRDKEDPVPMLRPDIYVKALAKQAANRPAPQAEQLNKLLNLLNNRWLERRNQRLQGMSAIEFKTANNTIPLEEAVSPGIGLLEGKPVDDAILVIVNNILDKLVTGTPANWSGGLEKLSLIDTSKDLEKLYNNFHQYRTNPPPGENLRPPRELESDEALFKDVTFSKPIQNITRLWMDWMKGEEFLGKNVSENTLCQATEFEADAWVPLLLANGWTTRGPENNPTG